MSTPPAQPPMTGIAGYFSRVITSLLSDLHSLLDAIPNAEALKKSTPPPERVYKVLLKPSATWLELREPLRVATIVAASSTEVDIRDAIVGVDVFSVQGGPEWLGQACAEGGWQAVEILAYFGRLKLAVENCSSGDASEVHARIDLPPSSELNPPRAPHISEAPSDDPLGPVRPPRTRSPTSNLTSRESKAALATDASPTSKTETLDRPPAAAVPLVVPKKKRGRPRKAKPADIGSPPEPLARPRIAKAAARTRDPPTLKQARAPKAARSDSVVVSSGGPSNASRLSSHDPLVPVIVSSQRTLESASTAVSLSAVSSSPPPAEPSANPSLPFAPPCTPSLSPRPSASTTSPRDPIPPLLGFAPPRPPKPDAVKKRHRPTLSRPATAAAVRRAGLTSEDFVEIYIPTPRESLSNRPQREKRLPTKIAQDGAWADAEGRTVSHWDDVRSAQDQVSKRQRCDELGGLGDGEEQTTQEDDTNEHGSLRTAARDIGLEGQVVAFVRFPNYSWWPAVILDPATAPAETQGNKTRDAYLVKSIPTGADHRWVPRDSSWIRPVQDSELDEIESGAYTAGKQVPSSWKKWRADLVLACRLIRNAQEQVVSCSPGSSWERSNSPIAGCLFLLLSRKLTDWMGKKTDLESRIEAIKEKRRTAKLSPSEGPEPTPQATQSDHAASIDSVQCDSNPT
ncbi:hypothetical protein JCM11491_007006 [Sporobolomyces phaffii]